MKLFVDDLRPPPEGWHLVKTIASAIKLLATQNVEQVSLDHDIAFPVYKDSMTMVSLSEENYSAIAWYIVIMEESIRPKVVFIHTSNPSGREHMDWILTDWYYVAIVVTVAILYLAIEKIIDLISPFADIKLDFWN